MTNIWFITGVSGGLGRAMAIEAAKKGNQVIGTLRQESQIRAFEDLVPGFTHGLLLDVVNQNQCSEVVKQIIGKFGRIDVLVNNAGYGLVGAIEELSEQELRAQMEVNFFGALHLTQLALPYMRQHKKGHIFNISSIAGVNGIGGLAMYNASKFALEGFSEGLMLELKPLGIKVTIVEPGPFRTNWAGGGLVHAARKIVDYQPMIEILRTRLAAGSGIQPGDPERAAKLIFEIALAENPPLRLLLGAPGYQIVETKYKRQAAEYEAWKEKGIKTDFPV
jgi:NAD(P)-dependent dehydrogenase (short-subunit alcohol dehydrogenase family)